jgi:ATP-binding cassette, subfamily F, member 3
MSLLTASNLSKVYEPDTIFSGVSAEIPHKARIALVGPNGAGKTSLVQLFIGADIPNEGQIHIAKDTTISYLPQRPELIGGHTLWDEQMRAFEHLHKMEIEMTELAAKMSDSPEALERYGYLQEHFERQGGYNFEARVRMILDGVGFTEKEYQTPLTKLSGGQKTRAVLARLLLENPDLLILDEPTNHLDIFAVEWLESFLKDYDGAVLAISHDRRFIDNFASAVWEMEFGRMEVYRGNYTQYLQQREERRELLAKEYEKQQEFLAKEHDYIRKHMGSRWTAQAKGRLKKLQTMEKRGKIIERGPRDRKMMHLHINAEARSGDKVIETESLTVGYAKPLFKVPDLVLWRGETAAIIGPNGAGKSTLLKTLTGEIKALAGQSRLGAQVQIGYFAQAHEGLNPEKSVLDVIMEAGQMGLADARNYAGMYLFSNDDVFRKIGTLSGGERGRVALAQLALSGANLLLLDEPTNHLDIDSQEILQAVIEAFKGTVLLVSHDRYLIDALASQIWAIRPDEGMEVYEGTYQEYLAFRKQREAQAASSANGGTASRKKAAQYTEKVRGMNPFQLKKRVEALEQHITQLESKLETLTAHLEQASSRGDASKVQSLGEQYTETESALESAMTEWGELAEYVE